MRKWYPVLPIGAALLLSAFLYGSLPARMATHWDAAGHPNGYSGRFAGAFLLPAMALILWGVLRGLPIIDPRRANYAKFQGTYDLVVDATVTLLAAIHVMVLGRAVGWPMPDPLHSAALGIGVLTLVLGNVMPRARPNWWFGIRTPWTLSSDTVWARTHRVGGYLFTAAGVVILLTLFLPANVAMGALIGVVAVASLGSVVYSYFVWKGEQS